MNKELEEAIERLKYIDRAYNPYNYYSKYDLDCIETVLNHIENSIPKEKVEDIIRKWKEKDYVYGSDHLIKKLQELLEDK